MADPALWIPYAINVRQLAQAGAKSLPICMRSALSVHKAHHLRAHGLVPATLTNVPGTNFVVSQKKIVTEYTIPSWTTRLFDLQDVDTGHTTRALMRKIEWHPVHESPLCVEFLRYSPTPAKAVKVKIPLEVENISRCAALNQGFFVRMVKKDVEVYTYLDPIPTAIPVNVADLKMGGSVRLSELYEQGAFPKGMWPATPGSSPNEEHAHNNARWVDYTLLKIARIR